MNAPKLFNTKVDCFGEFRFNTPLAAESFICQATPKKEVSLRREPFFGAVYAPGANLSESAGYIEIRVAVVGYSVKRGKKERKIKVF